MYRNFYPLFLFSLYLSPFISVLLLSLLPPSIHTDVRDETGVQNMTSLPRDKWAKLYQTLMKNPTNRRSLNLMGSAITLAVLETENPDVNVSTTYSIHNHQ